MAALHNHEGVAKCAHGVRERTKKWEALNEKMGKIGKMGNGMEKWDKMNKMDKMEICETKRCNLINKNNAWKREVVKIVIVLGKCDNMKI